MRHVRWILAIGGLLAALTASVVAHPAPVGAGGTQYGSSAVLQGSNEVGGGDPDGAGTAVVWLDPVANTVCFDLTVSAIGTPTAAHLHDAGTGVNGPIVVDFDIGTNGLDGCVTPEVGTTATAILADLNGFYVNVHTAGFSGGAIRGQLILAPTTTEDVNGNPSELSLRDAFDTANADTGFSIISLLLAEGATFDLTRCPAGVDPDDDANANGDLDHTEEASLSLLGVGATIRQTCPSSRVLHHQGSGTTDFDVINTVVTGGDALGDGGGILAAQTFVLESSVHGNAASGNGGGIAADTRALVQDSYVGRNAAGGGGGGIFSSGEAELIRATIQQNQALDGGGVSATTVQASHATFLRNDASGAAHLEANQLTSFASAYEADQSGVACDATIGVTSAGYNHVQSENAGDCAFSDPTDVVGVTELGLRPIFSGLLDVGAVLYPEVDSPLIDVVPVGVDCPDNDGEPCDAGAVELQDCTDEFTDVSGTHPFCNEIGWMGQTGVSTGTNPGPQYKPSPAVSRAAMSAFMYRLAGEPPFSPPGTATFTDVSTTHPFFAEIEWMNTEGITNGFGDGTYRPSAAVSRQAMSAFMYRLAGEPTFTPPGTPTFPDVGLSNDFFLEIEWMNTESITNGFGDGTYKPSAAVSRQAMAAFMYRFADGLLPGQFL